MENSNYGRNLIYLLLMLTTFWGDQLAAQDDLLNQKISIRFENITLKEALKKIEATSDVMTAYNEQELKGDLLSSSFEQASLKEILNTILKKTRLTYLVNGNTIVLFRRKKKNPLYLTKSSPPISARKKSEWKPIRSVATSQMRIVKKHSSE